MGNVAYTVDCATFCRPQGRYLIELAEEIPACDCGSNSTGSRQVGLSSPIRVTRPLCHSPQDDSDGPLCDRELSKVLHNRNKQDVWVCALYGLEAVRPAITDR